MIIKKAIIDKANRLYQLPPDIVSFTREKTRPTRIKKIDVLDLARFKWPKMRLKRAVDKSHGGVL